MDDIFIHPITDVTFVIGRNKHLVFYEVDMVGMNLKRSVILEKPGESLASVHCVEGVNNAICGITSHAVYVW